MNLSKRLHEWFWCEVGEAGLVPRGFGLVSKHQDMDGATFCRIPFNVVLRGWHELYYWMAIPFRRAHFDRKVVTGHESAYMAGMDYGVKWAHAQLTESFRRELKEVLTETELAKLEARIAALTDKGAHTHEAAS